MAPSSPSFFYRITRDSLSHNIFLMLQECNKFREHQAREILIELLEEQLVARKELLKELQENIDKADALLE
jgi:MED7 protein